jgi:hypothetical protein
LIRPERKRANGLGLRDGNDVNCFRDKDVYLGTRKLIIINYGIK